MQFQSFARRLECGAGHPPPPVSHGGRHAICRLALGRREPIPGEGAGAESGHLRGTWIREFAS